MHQERTYPARVAGTALANPDFVKLAAWAKEQGINGSAKELIGNPQVRSMIGESICAHLKQKFGGYEIPKNFVLVDEPFSVENGMLTQTLKLKRRKVVERYKDQIEAAYQTA